MEPRTEREEGRIDVKAGLELYGCRAAEPPIACESWESALSVYKAELREKVGGLRFVTIEGSPGDKSDPLLWAADVLDLLDSPDQETP